MAISRNQRGLAGYEHIPKDNHLIVLCRQDTFWWREDEICFVDAVGVGIQHSECLACRCICDFGICTILHNCQAGKGIGGSGQIYDITLFEVADDVIVDCGVIAEGIHASFAIQNITTAIAV